MSWTKVKFLYKRIEGWKRQTENSNIPVKTCRNEQLLNQFQRAFSGHSNTNVIPALLSDCTIDSVPVVGKFPHWVQSVSLTSVFPLLCPCCAFPLTQTAQFQVNWFLMLHSCSACFTASVEAEWANNALSPVLDKDVLTTDSSHIVASVYGCSRGPWFAWPERQQGLMAAQVMSGRSICWLVPIGVKTING